MAEVKVKITAANQTQTGFQSVLADAQKTAAQVQQTFAKSAPSAPRIPKTFTPDPAKVGPIDLGEYGLGPLRELQDELRKTREASQQAFDPEPPQQFGGSIGGIIGRFALIVGGAATVGKIIASAFDQAGEAIKRSIVIQEQFNRALAQAGQATSFENAVSGFQQLNALADQTGKTIDETFGRNIGEAVANLFQGRPGQLLANAGNFLTGGAVRGDLEDTKERQRRIARDTLSGNLAVQQQEREELLGAGGNADAIARIKREQEKRREVEALRSSFTDLSQPEQSAEFEKLAQALKEKQATDDLIERQKQLAAAKDEAAAAGRERSQAGMSSAQRLEQEKAAMKELQAEQAKFAQAASMAGVDPTGGLTEAAAKYYELQARIEQSQGRQQTLEAAIAKEVERKATTNVPVAIDKSGLATVQEIEQALDGVAKPIDIPALVRLTGAEDLDDLRQSIAAEDGKTIEIALQATGLSDLDALRAALDGVTDTTATAAVEASGLENLTQLKDALDVEDKTVIANLQAAGFEDLDFLRAALDEVGDKSVSVAVEASGLDNISQLKDALDVEDKTVIANLQAAGFEDLDALRAALDEVQPKEVDVILRALGTESIEEAQQLLGSLDATARAAIERAAAAKREESRTRDAKDQAQFERRGQSPEERRAALEAEQAALLAQAEALKPEDFAGRADVRSEALRIANELGSIEQGGFQGSSGASAFQRIGFASNEFFDTTKKDNTSEQVKQANTLIKKIADILANNTEPLVLPTSK